MKKGYCFAYLFVNPGQYSNHLISELKIFVDLYISFFTLSNPAVVEVTNYLTHGQLARGSLKSINKSPSHILFPPET
jgi:hypothetical protein